jgi:hypothetical protein
MLLSHEAPEALWNEAKRKSAAESMSATLSSGADQEIDTGSA